MKRLNEDIAAKNFARIYLLYGSEDYLKNRFKKLLSGGILPDDDGMNMSEFEGKMTDASGLIDACDTLPFFAQKRLVVVSDSGLFAAAKEEAARLADYIPEMPSSTHVIFIENEVKKTTKLYKAVEKAGYCTELVTPDENMLLSWVGKEISNRGLSAGKDVVRYMIMRVGQDMNRLACETEKLASYCMGRNAIEKEDIDAVCTVHIENHIFEMMEDMAYRRSQQAVVKYSELLRLREAPMSILYMFISQFRLFYHVYRGIKEGDNPSYLARRLKVNEYRVKKLAGWVRLYAESEVTRTLEQLAQTEQNIKSGVIGDSLAVELFIIEHAQRTNKKEKGAVAL